MTTSKLQEILDLVDQSIAIRKAVTFDMPTEIFKPLNRAAAAIINLADNKAYDALEDGDISEKERLIIKVAIDESLSLDLKKSWRQ